MGLAPAVADVRSAVRAALVGSTEPVLVACSGGADSLALAAAAAFVAPRAGVAAGLVTIDHGLVAGSTEQAQRVAAIGRGLDLDPVLVIAVDVGTSGGPEAAARTARYAALDGVATRLGARVLLGHTRDDQAETVLLGLGRGSGPRSIAGMSAADGPYLRPLLQLPRSSTAAACAALGMAPWRDPQNIDPSFERVRLRHEVLPLLEDVLQGGVVEALARTAELLRDDLSALDEWAAQVATSLINSASTPDNRGVDRFDQTLDADALAFMPRAVRTRVLRTWATLIGAPPLTAERTRALDALVVGWRGQGPIELPGGLAVRRASGRLVGFLSTQPVQSRPRQE